MALLIMFSLAGNLIGRRVGPHLGKDELCSSASVVMRVGSPFSERPRAANENELKEAGRRFERDLAPAASDRIESA
jgi:hypothetical protein